MAEVKVSALTALTGANVANGDELLINDVGSPNVSKKITADELAQATQFSSRYAPIANSRIFVEAERFRTRFGLPAMGTLGNASFVDQRWDAFLLDSAVLEGVYAYTMFPVGWTTCDIYVWWSNAGAGSGDVVLAGFVYSVGSSATTDVAAISGTTSTVTATAGAQYVTLRTKTNTTAVTCTAGNLVKLGVLRYGDNVADTLGNDIGVLGVELVRVS